MTIVWPGTPGESFTNNTDKILYQLVCSLVNTCGACMQYHLAIAKWWSPFHHGCACRSVPIYPNKTSAPYENFQDIIDSLPPEEQKKVVGASNMKLIEAGVVEWEDVVTSNRVKLLREVVSIKKLSVEDMTGAGVRKSIAEDAWSTVNTAAHVIADQQRTRLLQEIEALGVPAKHLKEMFGDIMAQQIGIGGGPSGVSVIPPGRSDQEWITILLRGFAGMGIVPKPEPKPEPKPKTEPEPEPQTAD